MFTGIAWPEGTLEVQPGLKMSDFTVFEVPFGSSEETWGVMGGVLLSVTSNMGAENGEKIILGFYR